MSNTDYSTYGYQRYELKVAVLTTLLTGIAYGEGQEIRRHRVMNMITGAYIVVYITSVYVIL